MSLSISEKEIEKKLKDDKKKQKKMSLNIHIMPKTETSHFQKWLVLSFLVFILIIIGILFLL